MLFVNDLYAPGVPQWLLHSTADVDSMGLADWVFPGFLMMVGLSIPYAVNARRKNGENDRQIIGHVLVRTVSLLGIGILVLNIGRLDPKLTGMDRNLWALCLYLCIFVIWNDYPKQQKRQRVYMLLRTAGVIGILVLIARFRAQPNEGYAWLTIGWWGILGLIGWGYFAASMTYIYAGDRLWATVLIWLFFLLLNISDQFAWLEVLHPIKGIGGVLISGNVPSIVLAGLTVSLLIRRGMGAPTQTAGRLLLLGGICLGLSLVLHNWFIISKIQGTPSWAMLCNGISVIIYAFLFIIVDIWGQVSWAKIFETAGKNSLTTYLAPDILYFICWGFGIPLFFYKQDANVWLAIAGSLLWAFAMIGVSSCLAKRGIRLRL